MNIGEPGESHTSMFPQKNNMIEQEPLVAEKLAGTSIQQLRQFAHNLAQHGETLGLIGPRELERLWTRHLINSALLGEKIQAHARVADIGTGGGMPGLVLAIIRPDAEFTLIEPMERRCSWLKEQITQLELHNATVKRGRAEEFHGAFEVDQVTARAVTALSKLVKITAPLLRDGGEMLFLKGESIHQEIESAQKELRKYKVHDIHVDTLGEELPTETTRVFCAQVR